MGSHLDLYPRFLLRPVPDFFLSNLEIDMFRGVIIDDSGHSQGVDEGNPMNTKQIAEEAAERLRRLANDEFDWRDIQGTIQSAIEKATVTMKRQLDDSLVRELEAVQERDDANVRAAHASELQFDPNFQIPPEIMEAAYTVHNYAIRSGFGKGWCIGPICDRDAHASDNQ